MSRVNHALGTARVVELFDTRPVELRDVRHPPRLRIAGPGDLTDQAQRHALRRQRQGGLTPII